MNREVFMMLASELRPYPQPGNSPRGQDVLSVEKQLAVTFYYLKDQSSLARTANAFGVALCAVSVVVRKVCDVVMVLRPQFIKLPSIPQEMATIGKFFGFEIFESIHQLYTRGTPCCFKQIWRAREIRNLIPLNITLLGG